MFPNAFHLSQSAQMCKAGRPQQLPAGTTPRTSQPARRGADSPCWQQWVEGFNEKSQLMSSGGGSASKSSYIVYVLIAEQTTRISVKRLERCRPSGSDVDLTFPHLQRAHNQWVNRTFLHQGPTASRKLHVLKSIQRLNKPGQERDKEEFWKHDWSNTCFIGLGFFPRLLLLRLWLQMTSSV